MRVAPAEFAVVWRDVVAEEGPSGAAEAVCGPAFVGTSATLVTVLLWTAWVARALATCDGPGVVEGESALLLEVAVRRAVFVLVLGVVFAATVVGRGWPVVGACSAPVAVSRRVAVLVGESSPVVATSVAAAAVVSTRVADGVLGAAFALRVSVGVWFGFAVAAGAFWPVVRVMREAT